MVAPVLSRVPKLDMLTGLVCKLLSPGALLGIDSTGAIDAIVALRVVAAAGASDGLLIPFPWAPKSAPKAAVCGLGLCCRACSRSNSIFRFFCSDISAAAVSSTGEVSGDKIDFGENGGGALPTLVLVTEADRGLPGFLARLRGFTGLRKVPASAVAERLVGDVVEEGVAGRAVFRTGSAVGVDCFAAIVTDSAM